MRTHQSRTSRPGVAPAPPTEDVALEPSADGRGRVPAPPRALLERARRREPEALEAFFDHYFHHLYGVVFRMVGDRDLAEDLTQEVFFKVFRAIHHLDTSRDPASWLIAIAANACRDLWRSGAQRMARRATTMDDETVLGASDPADPPDAALIARERERLVQKAIAGLPPAFRLAVVLHDYAGLGHGEVAVITGVREAAARKRYSRALRLLAETLRGRLE